MYGLAVNLTMSVSGHPSIINEIKYCLQYQVSIEEIFCDSSFNTSENEMRIARKCYKKVLLIVFLNLKLELSEKIYLT